MIRNAIDENYKIEYERLFKNDKSVHWDKERTIRFLKLYLCGMTDNQYNNKIGVLNAIEHLSKSC